MVRNDSFRTDSRPPTCQGIKCIHPLWLKNFGDIKGCLHSELPLQSSCLWPYCPVLFFSITWLPIACLQSAEPILPVLRRFEVLAANMIVPRCHIAPTALPGDERSLLCFPCPFDGPESVAWMIVLCASTSLIQRFHASSLLSMKTNRANTG